MKMIDAGASGTEQAQRMINEGIQEFIVCSNARLIGTHDAALQLLKDIESCLSSKN